MVAMIDKIAALLIAVAAYIAGGVSFAWYSGQLFTVAEAEKSVTAAVTTEKRIDSVEARADSSRRRANAAAASAVAAVCPPGNGPISAVFEAEMREAYK
jgi:hypothetical protein